MQAIKTASVVGLVVFALFAFLANKVFRAQGLAMVFTFLALVCVLLFGSIEI